MAKTQVTGTSSKPTQAAAEPKEKKAKVARKVHPLVGSKDAKVYPFPSIPTDFDFKTMKILKKKDFADGAIFFEFKAREMEHKAGLFREKAKEEAVTGGGKAKQAKKRFVKMVDKMAELKKQLEDQGVDINELMANLQKAKEEKDKATATK